MAKIRVYELARELKCTNKDLLKLIEELGIAVKSHMTSIDESEATKIKKGYLIKFNNTLKIPHNSPRLERFREKYSKKLIRNKSLDKNKTKPDKVIDEALPENHRIEIKGGETGHTYENLFGKYLKNSEKVVLEDKYIKIDYQIKNFVRFCGMLEKMKKIKTIELITGYDDEEQKVKATHAFADLRKSLKINDIELLTKFDNTIHDRVIKSDDGWIIDLGKGLDIYKSPGSWYVLEADDYERRPCVATTINISRI